LNQDTVVLQLLEKPVNTQNSEKSETKDSQTGRDLETTKHITELSKLKYKGETLNRK
jgi:hypothetical protein